MPRRRRKMFVSPIDFGVGSGDDANELSFTCLLSPVSWSLNPISSTAHQKTPYSPPPSAPCPPRPSRGPPQSASQHGLPAPLWSSRQTADRPVGTAPAGLWSPEHAKSAHRLYRYT